MFKFKKHKKQKKSEYLKAMYNDIKRYEHKTDTPTEKILFITFIFTSNYYNYNRNHVKLTRKYLNYTNTSENDNKVKKYFIRICSDLKYIIDLIMSEVNPNVHIALDKHSLFIETTFKIVSSPYWINYSFDKEILNSIQTGLSFLVKDIKQLQEIKLIEYEQEKEMFVNSLLEINQNLMKVDSTLADSKQHTNHAIQVINSNITTLKSINNDLLESVSYSHLLQQIRKENYSRIVYLNFNAFDKINKDIKIFDYYEYLNWYDYTHNKIIQIVDLLNKYQLDNNFKSENQKKIFEKYRIKFMSLKHMLKTEAYSNKNQMPELIIENYCIIIKLGITIDSCLNNTIDFLSKLPKFESISDNDIEKETDYVKNNMEEIRLLIRVIIRKNSSYINKIDDLIKEQNDLIDKYIIENVYLTNKGIKYEKYSNNLLNVIKLIIEFATNNPIALRKLKDISQYLLLYSYENLNNTDINMFNLYETFSLLTVIQYKFNLIFNKIDNFSTNPVDNFTNHFNLSDLSMPNTTKYNEILKWTLNLNTFLDNIIRNLNIDTTKINFNVITKHKKELITKKELIDLIQNNQIN